MLRLMAAAVVGVALSHQSAVAGEETIDEALKTATAAVDKGDRKKAIETLDEAIKKVTSDKRVRLDEEVAPLYLLRGRCHKSEKAWELATKDLRRAVELAPKDHAALDVAAWLAATCPVEKFRDGKYAVATARKTMDAISKMMEDAENGPKDPAIPSRIHYLFADAFETLAAASAEAGEWQDAVKYQRAAIEGFDVHANGGAGDVIAYNTPVPGVVSRERLTKAKSRLELYRNKMPYREQE